MAKETPITASYASPQDADSFAVLEEVLKAVQEAGGRAPAYLISKAMFEVLDGTMGGEGLYDYGRKIRPNPAKIRSATRAYHENSQLHFKVGERSKPRHERAETRTNAVMGDAGTIWVRRTGDFRITPVAVSRKTNKLIKSANRRFNIKKMAGVVGTDAYEVSGGAEYNDGKKLNFVAGAYRMQRKEYTRYLDMIYRISSIGYYAVAHQPTAELRTQFKKVKSSINSRGTPADLIIKTGTKTTKTKRKGGYNVETNLMAYRYDTGLTTAYGALTGTDLFNRDPNPVARQIADEVIRDRFGYLQAKTGKLMDEIIAQRIKDGKFSAKVGEWYAKNGASDPF